MIRSAISPKPKLSRCKACHTPFEKRSMAHIACTPKCALSLAAVAREKKARADYKVRKEALKTLSDYKSETQAVVNQFIRLRDADLPCISCGRHHQGQYHAGHYKSVGAHPALRFNESNIHKQCQPCNTQKSGNILEYRRGLLAKCGAAVVDFLEGPHAAAHYSVEDCQRIKAEYKARIKQLQQKSSPASAQTDLGHDSNYQE